MTIVTSHCPSGSLISASMFTLMGSMKDVTKSSHRHKSEQWNFLTIIMLLYRALINCSEGL